jgi:DNA-binding NtrC family response regulator
MTGKLDGASPVTSLISDIAAFTQKADGGVFLVIQGPDRGEQVCLGTQPLVFGSSPNADLPLSDKTVSRRHLTATREGGAVVLRDAGSTNGSYVGEVRFKEIAINYGTEVRIGRTVLKLIPEEVALAPGVSATAEWGTLLGRDLKMRRLFGLLGDVAPSEATVLIEGETGSGKELVAEEIHRHSRRAGKPFVVFDCGAVPRELIEAALFGHVKGAFTGAGSDRKGAFGEAAGGTVFLDEIGELPLDLQPALLRVLDKRAIKRVGAAVYEPVDVRIVAATNRDLRALVAARGFREDLYYRLAVIRVGLPALRERPEDIPLLVEAFVARFAAGRRLAVSPADMARLVRHPWPGNVRELRNVIERACVLARSETLELGELGVTLPDGGGGPVRSDLPFKEAKAELVEQFEREYLAELLKRHRMNLSAAAREAQLDRKHLRELVRKYNLGDVDD